MPLIEDPNHQIQSFILNVVRTTASAMSLEHLYTEKNKIAEEVETELKGRLADYGYVIDAVLIDQPSPPVEVQEAFNRVIATQRAQEAARLEAEAEKESKKLSRVRVFLPIVTPLPKGLESPSKQ